MMRTFRWLGEQVTDNGITERRFQLHRRSGPVPGLLWLPADWAPSRPLVLLGHGGSGHKRSDRILPLARSFCSQAGIAPLAIDGPYHGDRVGSPLSAAAYQARIVAEGLDVVIDRVVEDWRETLDAIAAVTDADTASVGYVGVSMGARFGLPLGAAIGNQLRCAVLGKFGLQQAAIAGQLAVFDLLKSPDKQLIAFSGPHAETGPEATAAWCRFICSTSLGQLQRGTDATVAALIVEEDLETCGT